MNENYYTANLGGKLIWKDPKQCGYQKRKTLPLAIILNPRKKTQILELGKLMLTFHKGKKIYIPRIEKQETKINEIR